MTDLQRRPLVIYHGACFDGFAAAWAFHLFRDHDVEYYAATYGQDPPDCKQRRVWLLDFCYQRDVLIDKVILPSLQTTIYDHHKTAEKALEGLQDELRDRGAQRQGDKIVFDMKRSGAGITYDELETTHGRKRGFHFPRFNGQRRERLIDYIEDRDLWKFELKDSEAISAWISTIPFTFEEYNALAAQLNDAATRLALADKGAAILKYIDLYGDKACAHAQMQYLGSHKVPVINVPYMNCSEHIGKLAKMHPEAPFAAGFFLRDDGLWQFGLRSRGDFDVSEVAKQYGGGGHKSAAGFQVPELPWVMDGISKAVENIHTVSTVEDIDKLATEGHLSKPAGIIKIDEAVSEKDEAGEPCGNCPPEDDEEVDFF